MVTPGTHRGLALCRDILPNFDIEPWQQPQEVAIGSHPIEEIEAERPRDLPQVSQLSPSWGFSPDARIVENDRR